MRASSKKKPTKKQVIEYIKKVKKIPTVSEIALACDISPGTASHYWKASDMEKIGISVLNGLDINEESDEKIRSLEQNVVFLEKQVKEYKKVDDIEKKILESIEQYASLIPARRVIKKFKHEPSESDEEAIIPISDCHFPEIVNSDEMRGINEYNLKIGVIRIQYYLDTCRKILAIQQEGKRKIRTVNVPFLGDIVSGDIHEDLMKSNECPTLESALITADVFSQFLRELAQDYDVRTWGVCGNHGRLTKKTQYKQKYNNLDWLTYRIIEKSVQDVPNIKCEFSKALFEIKNIQGNSCAFCHGDDIPSTWGVPYYGIAKKDGGMTSSLLYNEERYKYHFMGHFHHWASQPRAEGMIFVNPSVKGPDEYSLARLSRVFPPMQVLYGMHRKKGLIYADPIDLRPAVKEISNKDIRFNYALKG
jgi:hypothetical protein